MKTKNYKKYLAECHLMLNLKPPRRLIGRECNPGGRTEVTRMRFQKATTHQQESLIGVDINSSFADIGDLLTLLQWSKKVIM